MADVAAPAAVTLYVSRKKGSRDKSGRRIHVRGGNRSRPVSTQDAGSGYCDPRE